MESENWEESAMNTYAEFLNRKRRVYSGAGVNPPTLPDRLHDWQAAIVRWALRKGRACVWADTGLGKTYMQVAWAHALGVRTLILAPLCVAEQTVAQAAELGIDVTYATEPCDAGITITNYERIGRFDPSRYKAVVLDESSILKAFDGKTRTKLIQVFSGTPYRLCCTATPAPNDIAELANHAEFLGLMTRPEFLATWFVHDDDGWRMKRHAVDAFYRWMSSWAMTLKLPSDIGYDNNGYVLPKLTIRDRVVPMDGPIGDSLFPELALKGIGGRLKTRRGSVGPRVDETARLISDANSGCQWIVWCGLNDEADRCAEAIDGAVNVQGSDAYDTKVSAVKGFVAGDIRVIVTKPKILGFGMNFQNCHHMAFLGLSDSYESYYQCIRRCWRFGQTSPVDAHVVVSDAERLVVENVRRKETEARSLSMGLLRNMTKFEREELKS